MDFETLCLHAGTDPYDRTGAVSVPIYQSATFARSGVGESTGFDYSRLQNPTREHLEHLVAQLEGGCDALAFSTGMAAITALMELFSPGDHIVASDDLYGGTHRLFQYISRKNGLVIDLLPTADLNRLQQAICPQTKLILVETPTNPMMDVTDIAAVAAIAKENGVLLAVDNTFLTPYFQRPLDLGADIIIHSGTKFLGGHNDTLAGFLVLRSPELSERARFIYKTIGACLSPFDSWLLIRGIKTLAVRLERQQNTAKILAEWLCGQSHVRAVHYAGLANHPGYEISCRQATGFGSMISIEVDSEETAHRILSGVKVIQFAESLGGVESLITYPMTQTHADLPREDREARGINERLLRLSVGLEAPQDLLQDLEQAMKR